MPRKPPPLKIDFHQARFTQISESHCGPAVIQMLLGNLGIEVTQAAVAEAAGVADLIEANGTRVDQLALAVQRLAPQAAFWYKDHATFQELATIVRQYGYPVGVEWQGLFDDEAEAGEQAEKPVAGFTLPDAETEDEDYGHYSVVISVRMRPRRLVIADPYKDYIDQDRIFTFKEFRQRWWDYNEVPDPHTGRLRLVEDYHMLFVVTEKDAAWPGLLNLRTFA